MRKLPLRGVGGLIFTAAIVGLAVVYIRFFRLFLGIAIPIGLLIAIALHFWHKHTPAPEPEGKKKVLHLDD